MSFEDVASPLCLTKNQMPPARGAASLEKEFDTVQDEISELQDELDKIHNSIADRLSNSSDSSEEDNKDPNLSLSFDAADYQKLSLDDLKAREQILNTQISKALKLGKNIMREEEELEVERGERKAIESLVLA